MIQRIVVFGVIFWGFLLPTYSKEKNPIDTLNIKFMGVDYSILCEKENISKVVYSVNKGESIDYDSVKNSFITINKVLQEKQENGQLPNWMVYQFIRRIAEEIHSKYIDYKLYTITKYILLSLNGFEPLVFVSNEKILLYIKSADTIYNLPIKVINGKQYVCLNYHDYDYQIDFKLEQFHQQHQPLIENGKNFTYTINYLPSFAKASYLEKQIKFNYRNQTESYRLLINPETQDYFTNYPVTEYRYQFNIPFSEITYQSLIPLLKQRLKTFTVEKGIEYLMIFVRDGFQFETDTKLFGREKRLSAEETLVYNSSDCEDRSALFFSLVKEIYNLPMIILSYPEHVNVGVELPQKKGHVILYDNRLFTICEPTPQKNKKGIGWMPKQISKQPFEIAYFYERKKELQ